MREPVFTETLQVAIVVRDLEAAMRTYVDDFGIGPWDSGTPGADLKPDATYP
jgi:hypothetical protein